MPTLHALVSPKRRDCIAYYASRIVRGEIIRTVNCVDVPMPDGSLYRVRSLLASGESNAKLARNRGYMTLGLSLAPSDTGGAGNICPRASQGCRHTCINRSGRTAANNSIADHILRARMARSRFWFFHREAFIAMLHRDLTRGVRAAAKHGLQLLVRLNVFSDIDWARRFPDVITSYPSATFYGYTKLEDAYGRYLDGHYPPNYHLTFSRSEDNEDVALEFLRRGGHVAIPFNVKYGASSKDPLPLTWRGFPVIDGDETDLRITDPDGACVVGLRAKGRARARGMLANGFVVDMARQSDWAN